jgi:hypothetical protein
MDINTFGLNDIMNLNRVRHRDKKMLPQIACVYFAVAKGSVLYIGKADNLYKRWIGHHKEDELSAIDDVFIYYLQADVNILLGLEGSLIRKFNPILNKIIPVDPQKRLNSPRGIAVSIRIDEDIYTSLCQTASQRRIRGENIDVTKLINECLRTFSPTFAWDRMEQKIAELEQKIDSLKN